MSAAWSAQVAGHAQNEIGALDLTNFQSAMGLVLGERFRLVPGWASQPDRRSTTSDLPRPLRNRRTHSACWRAEQTERHRLEVPHDGGKVKLVTRAGEPSEPHAFKAMVHLEVSKTHLNALAFIPRFEEVLCPH
jgi:hypothetical protein